MQVGNYIIGEITNYYKKGAETMDEKEQEMKEHLRQLFITLSETSKNCEQELLPQITTSMLSIYALFRTIQF